MGQVLKSLVNSIYLKIDKKTFIRRMRGFMQNVRGTHGISPVPTIGVKSKLDIAWPQSWGWGNHFNDPWPGIHLSLKIARNSVENQLYGMEGVEEDMWN